MIKPKTYFRLGGTLILSVLLSSTGTAAPLKNLVIQGGGGTRFTRADQGIPVSYVVDADAFPTNFTLPQVLTALSNAFNAWSDVTYVQFHYDGLQSFGGPVEPVAKAPTNQDHRIWVQLHDLYSNIGDGTQPGVGGNRASISQRLFGAEWTGGGNIDGHDFFDIIVAWVGINHTNAAFNSLETLEEVLCHNIGRALGVETNVNDTSSIMYYQTHADGRGAQLGNLDIKVIQQVYPSNNSAPFTFDRQLEAVTTPTNQPPLNVPGVNQVLLRGYDLQTTNLTLEVTNVYAVLGSFTNQNGLLSYTPNDFNETTNVLTDYLFFRYSDGVHHSPYKKASVKALRKDSYPIGTGDGVPDYFMVNYFGNPDPSAGSNREANKDNDGDTLSNLKEYLGGMNPTDELSAQRVSWLPNGMVQWQTKPGELYELQSSLDMSAWVLVKPVLATNSTTSVWVEPRTDVQKYYRAVKIR